MKKGKRIILLAILVTIMSSGFYAAHAQTPRAGIKGGMNFSNLYIDEVNDENMRLGFHIGIFKQFLAPSGLVGIQPELLYSSKGAKATYDIFGFNGERKFNMNYVDLPVTMVFKLGNDVDLNFGGYASYLINTSISTEGDLGNSYEELDRDNFKSIDYGLVGGLGLNLQNMTVGVRYNYGLRQIADDDNAETFLGDAKHGVGQIFLEMNLNK